MHTNPAKRFGISAGIKTGGRADITVFDLDEEYIIDPDDFLSKGKSTPFEGFSVFGRCITVSYTHLQVLRRQYILRRLLPNYRNGYFP